MVAQANKTTSKNTTNEIEKNDNSSTVVPVYAGELFRWCPLDIANV